VASLLAPKLVRGLGLTLEEHMAAKTWVGPFEVEPAAWPFAAVGFAAYQAYSGAQGVSCQAEGLASVVGSAMLTPRQQARQQKQHQQLSWEEPSVPDSLVVPPFERPRSA
jgi:hypothetical protein